MILRKVKVIITKTFWFGVIVGLIFGGFIYRFVFLTSVNPPDKRNISNVSGAINNVLFSGRGASASGNENSNVLETFTHPELDFTLQFPGYLEVERFDEGSSAETIVFQKPNEKIGFQVFIIPYSENEITKERLQADVKGGVIDEPIEVLIGSGGYINALIFWSNDPVVGRLREAWFVHNGFLYEVTTYADLDEWLADILGTWKFVESKSS